MDQSNLRIPAVPDVLGAQLNRRDVAAQRSEPLHDARRDPVLEEPVRPRRPCGYGLSGRELIAEAARLRALGWQPWELDEALTHPPVLAVAA